MMGIEFTFEKAGLTRVRVIQVVANKLSKTNRSIHISSIDGARSDRHLLEEC